MSWFKKKKKESEEDVKMVDLKKIFNKTVTQPSTLWSGVLGATVNTTPPGNTFNNCTIASGAAAQSSTSGNTIVHSAINVPSGHNVPGSNQGQASVFYNTANSRNNLTIFSPNQGWGIYNSANSAVLIINGNNNQEIVKISSEGEVTWASEIQIDEAAEAFGKSLTLGVEIAAGIRYATKQKMRDLVFEEIIKMAEERGGLSASDLTYIHQSAKIMDKLKGL